MTCPRLLVVDDGLDLLQLISVRLIAAKYEVIAAESGEQALLSFLSKPLDGHELLRRVSDAARISPALYSTHESALWRRYVHTDNRR